MSMQHFVVACVPAAFEESPELQIECTLRKKLFVKTDDHVSVLLGWSSYTTKLIQTFGFFFG